MTFLKTAVIAVMAFLANTLSVEASAFGDIDFEFQNGNTLIPFDTAKALKKNYWDSSEIKKDKQKEGVALYILGKSLDEKKQRRYVERKDFVDIFMEEKESKGDFLVTLAMHETSQLFPILNGLAWRDQYDALVKESIDDLPKETAQPWFKALCTLRKQDPSFFRAYFDLIGLYIYEDSKPIEVMEWKNFCALILRMNDLSGRNGLFSFEEDDTSLYMHSMITRSLAIELNHMNFPNNNGIQVSGFDGTGMSHLRELFIQSKSRCGKGIINLPKDCKIYRGTCIH